MARKTLLLPAMALWMEMLMQRTGGDGIGENLRNRFLHGLYYRN